MTDGDEVEQLVIGVRADLGGFRRDVDAMRGELAGPFAAGAKAAGTMLERSLMQAVRTGKLGFDDLKRVALSALAQIAAAALKSGAWRRPGRAGYRRDADVVARRAGAGDGRAGVARAGLRRGRAGTGAVRADGERAGGVERRYRRVGAGDGERAGGGARGDGRARSAGAVGATGRARGPAQLGGLGMPHWLASKADVRTWAHVKRFDSEHWTVNFPRPMVAAVVTTGAHDLRVECVFYRRDDLAGLIWASEDAVSHPLCARETARDYRGCTLEFEWRSGGIRALDAVHGPTLTIEGRDAEGQARAWYVRLWNYAQGSPEAARVRLDFDALAGGFLHLGEADPVWAGDVDRMFISLVAPGYDGTDGALPAPAEGWAELRGIRCDGPGSVIRVGGGWLPAHDLRIATGYDDLYHLPPARVLHMAEQLGYRALINHYVGMSHYFRLTAGGGHVDVGATAVNAPCLLWHRSFAAEAAKRGYDLIWSLSYELLDRHCWNDWKQLAADGSPGLTGWDPPSALLSPANPAAMDYLRAVALDFCGVAAAAGLPVKFQVGEPWWWVKPATGEICLHDAGARAALGWTEAIDVRGALSAAQVDVLTRAGGLLAASTAALAGAVKAAHPGAETLLLVYLPTVLDQAAPELRRANVPVGWAAPAFDVLQLEDYDWAALGRAGATRRGVAAMTSRLGYPLARQHYFAGFVLRPEDRAQWSDIARAAEAAKARGVPERFVWALPQVLRDGWTYWQPQAGEEADMQAFDDVLFPIAIGREASVTPAFSTAVVTSASGAERRNADWADARMRYDAGPGVRSEAEVGTLLAFFRARRGAARGFRFEDPLDNSSAGMTGTPSARDQRLGVGDGLRTAFALVKRYGEGGDAQMRRITCPVAGSVRVAVGGVEQSTGWLLQDGGVIEFEEPPAAGAVVIAGFRFHVPVRFAEDRLELGAGIGRGEAASVPLVEVRP